MEKPINQKKDLSGQENKSYNYNGLKIEIADFFLYEVNLYKYWSGGYCLLGTKLFKSDQFLDIKVPRMYKKSKEYILEKEILFLAAPYDFIEELCLPVYKYIPFNKKGKKRK